MRRADLRVGGLTPFTTVDWPGRLSATVFTRGCPWDCAYCHNPHLIGSATATGDPSWGEILDFLERRTGLLEAVVFSGGEPAAQRALPDAIDEVAALGFQVGLHTNGAFPERLSALLPKLAWVGLDVKTAFSVYSDITGVLDSGDLARESLQVLALGGVDFEVRTTMHSRLHDAETLRTLARDLDSAGVRRWAIQLFRATGVRSGVPDCAGVGESELRDFLCDFTGELVIRGA